MASFDPAVVVAALKKGGLYGAPYTPKAWVPTVDLGVAYPDSGAIVSLGNKLTPKETAPYPALAFAAVRPRLPFHGVLGIPSDSLILLG